MSYLIPSLWAVALRSALDQRSAALAAAPSFARPNEDASTALYAAGRKTVRDVLDTRTAALDDEDQLVQAQMGQANRHRPALSGTRRRVVMGCAV